MGNTGVSSPADCPVCDDETVETDVYGLNGICEGCGFVLQADREAIPEWAVSSAEASTGGREQWMEVSRVRNATEHRLATAFGVIESIGAQFALPSTLRSQTADIFCRGFRADVTDGRETESMIAASLRLASLCETQPIPAGRLTALGMIERSSYRNCYSALQSAIDLTVPPATPASYLWFLQHELSLDAQTVQTTRERLLPIEECGSLTGKNPAGIAGGCLYVTATDITQQTVADAVAVSTETIRLRAADIREATV